MLSMPLFWREKHNIDNAKMALLIIIISYVINRLLVKLMRVHTAPVNDLNVNEKRKLEEDDQPIVTKPIKQFIS